MPSAQDDLRAAHAYHAERSPTAPDRVIGVILRAANGLAQFPLLGRVGAVPGTRERLVTRYPYQIIYHTMDDTAEVLRVLHSAPSWP
ncbi:MAG TPA: type II toxin-antitoxin system RelE/ParE family toxin [Chloroflexota bacterium]|nr:type II toxin-antitoxin system RelE/ParE family toxin [Chloroflexota bacterium]